MNPILSEETLSSVSSSGATSLPAEVVDVLKSTKIGYLSLASKKGDIYSYPLAFHYSGYRIYLMTVKESSKIKLMKANPNVSFLVDNKKLALECAGAMVQGKAKVLSLAKMMATIYTIGPKSLLEWNRKYPGLLSFYAKGKDLPEERKLYKYRFIRIEPSKIIYWTGYKFGRYVPQRKLGKDNEHESLDPSNPESFANMLATVDEELEGDQIPADPGWLDELNSAVSTGILSEDEKRVIGMRKKLLGVDENLKPGELSSGDKSILKKWKAEKTR